MYVGWKGLLNKNLAIFFGDICDFLVLESSWYKGFLVFYKFMKKILWTWGCLIGEGDCEVSSLDRLGT